MRYDLRGNHRTEARYVLDNPGPVRIEFGNLAGYRPIPPRDFVVEPQSENPLEVRLEPLLPGPADY